MPQWGAKPPNPKFLPMLVLIQLKRHILQIAIPFHVQNSILQIQNKLVHQQCFSYILAKFKGIRQKMTEINAVLTAWGIQNSQFLTNNLPYLKTKVRQSHSYYETLLPIELCDLWWLWVTTECYFILEINLFIGNDSTTLLPNLKWFGQNWRRFIP